MQPSREIYLDNNATTRVLPLAANAANDVMKELYGNPSSSHITGLRARHLMESARKVAMQVLGVETGRIVFTSGATEAIETSIFSTLCSLKERQQEGTATKGRKLLYAATEHKAVSQALAHWNHLLGTECEIMKIPVDNRGRLDLEFLKSNVDEAEIVCTMAVNNETGVIHNLEAIQAILAPAAGRVRWLVDCVQAVGKMSLKLSKTTIDYAPVSGHKLYAPKGIGMLYVREGAPITPLMSGGGQEGGVRGGTENLPGVAALAAVLRCLKNMENSVADDDGLQRDAPFRSERTLNEFRDRLVASLRAAFPGIVFNTPFEDSVPTTINFSVEHFSSKEILDLFDAAGVRVSSGSACGSAIQGSFVLEAMGLPAWQSEGAIRLSFGPATTDSEVSAACLRIEDAGKALSDACLVVSSEFNVSPGMSLDGLVQLKMGSNCSWLLTSSETRRCVVIDPFIEMAERLETLIRCQGSQVAAVLDTHQHVDHASPRNLVCEVLGERLERMNDPCDVLGWYAGADETIEIGDGTQAPVLRIASDLVLAKTTLPGHTVDSTLFLVGAPDANGALPRESVKFAFPGDTLQIGGIGRTDFPTSAPEQMLSSLRRLPKLISLDTVICPTHDYAVGFVTTLASERKNNPFLARVLDETVSITAEQFLEEKQKIDAEIDDASNCELVCGRIENKTESGCAAVDLTSEQLPEFFREHAQSRIVDVREPQEFRFAQNWEGLGLSAPPENVPLTRLANFFARSLESLKAENQPIVFLCRSGNRSAKAAEVARRLGINNAFNIAGGIALGAPASSVEQDEMEYII